MKISTFKLYKPSIIASFIFGAIVVILLNFSIYFDTNYFNIWFLFITILVGILIALLPLFIYHRQIISVYFESDGCTSYSICKKKLCQIDYNKNVYYSFFDVHYAYSNPIRFIAFSNEPFVCEQRPGISFIKKKFFGTYNRKRIVVFPYGEELSLLLKLNEWHMVL